MDKGITGPEKWIAAWQAKAGLRAVYQRYFREIKDRLSGPEGSATVELGSGIGVIREVIPWCVTSDIGPNKYVDRVEDACRLTYADAVLDNVIMFDVLHHIEFPFRALAECHRVLKPGGRVVLFEPAVSLAGLIVYGIFHREPLALFRRIETGSGDPSVPADGTYSAQGNCWRITGRMRPRLVAQGWTVRETVYFPGLAYVLTGGYTGPVLAPDRVIRYLLGHERPLGMTKFLTAIRMLVVLEKN